MHHELVTKFTYDNIFILYSSCASFYKPLSTQLPQQQYNRRVLPEIISTWAELGLHCASGIRSFRNAVELRKNADTPRTRY